MGTGGGEEVSGWVRPEKGAEEKSPDPSQSSADSHAAWPTKMAPNPKGKLLTNRKFGSAYDQQASGKRGLNWKSPQVQP